MLMILGAVLFLVLAVTTDLIKFIGFLLALASFLVLPFLLLVGRV